jgi:2'-5' RNA ligase
LPKGRLFRSFDESWSAFLERREPLESFVEELERDPPPAGDELAVWLIEPDEPVASASAEVQSRLPPLHWLRLLPRHYLHVFVGAIGWTHALDLDDVLGRGELALEGADPFAAVLRRLNCFHTAVVAEVAPRKRFIDLRERLLPDCDTESMLPHMTLAVVTEPAQCDPLRETLVPLRETELGSFAVDRVTLCSVPVAQSRVLEPWNVLGRVGLGVGLGG